MLKRNDYCFLLAKIVAFKLSQEKKTAMIKLDNLWKLQSIFKEIILVATDAGVQDDSQRSVKICQLLEMLVHMQSLNVSIRTELIGVLLSTRPDFPPDILNQIRNGANNIILFDRRKAKPDRRRLHTFLASDRRSGIADRRQSIKKI